MIARLLNRYQININLGNTHYKRCEDVGLFSQTDDWWGLSGPSLYSRTFELVELVAPIGPIVATGGISSVSSADVLAGATLVVLRQRW